MRNILIRQSGFLLSFYPSNNCILRWTTDPVKRKFWSTFLKVCNTLFNFPSHFLIIYLNVNAQKFFVILWNSLGDIWRIIFKIISWIISWIISCIISKIISRTISGIKRNIMPTNIHRRNSYNVSTIIQNYFFKLFQ